MKKILILITIIMLTGCMKYTELNDLAIIKSIGIEYTNNYNLYLEIIDEVKKDNKPKTKIIKIDGKSIQEVFKKIKNNINKDIYLSHIDLLILDEKLSNSNYQDIIHYFINNNELRNDFFTIISDDINHLLEKTKYNEIEELIQNNKNTIIKTSFEEIISNYLDNKDFYLSKIIYDNELKFIDNIKIERTNNE